MRKGNANVHLGVVDEMPDGRRFAHIALHVPADEFADTMDELAARGVPFATNPALVTTSAPPVWAAFITDPTGNRIELTDAAPVVASSAS